MSYYPNQGYPGGPPPSGGYPSQQHSYQSSGYGPPPQQYQSVTSHFLLLAVHWLLHTDNFQVARLRWLSFRASSAWPTRPAKPIWLHTFSISSAPLQWWIQCEFQKQQKAYSPGSCKLLQQPPAPTYGSQPHSPAPNSAHTYNPRPSE